MPTTYDTLKIEYAVKLAKMEVQPASKAQIERAAKYIFANKERYLAVSAKTNVPWPMIGCLHWRESTGNFSRHLHNGDPLTARTRHIPAGRPSTGHPPFTWEESAIDALTFPPHQLDKVPAWPVERVLYEMERWNGWGYRKPGRPASPYLWAGTNQYSQGKYVADGVYSATTRDTQLGCVPMWLRVLEMEVEAAALEGPVAAKISTFKTVTKGCIAGGTALFTLDNFTNLKAVQEWLGTAIDTKVFLGAAVIGVVAFIAFKGIEATLKEEKKNGE